MDNRHNKVSALQNNPNVTEDHITKALEDEDFFVRKSAIKHPKANSDHITKALDDEDVSVRYAAIQHPNSTKEHITKAMADDNANVRVKAIEKRNHQKITESLDSPATIEKIPETSMLHMMGSMSAQMVGGNNFSMHKIGDDLGYLIRYEKEGHTEFHHVDENLGGGYKRSIPTKGGLKFVSTMVDSIKKSLDSGESVKISAHHNLSNNFGRIIDRVSKRYPEYVVSNGAEETHPITQDKLKSWTIKHR